MTEQERLEVLVKEVAAGTEKILREEIRALILRSAPTLAAVNGEQACHLLVHALDAWGEVPVTQSPPPSPRSHSEPS